MATTRPPLNTVLPPLVFGTATFNYQYADDPSKIPATELVHRAFEQGIRAFDTSPYYGPSEGILGMLFHTPLDPLHFQADNRIGKALIAPFQDTGKPFPREDYKIVTKVGRHAGNSFNYSKEWVYKSIQRSLKRLHTPYLDVVYCHDVEFVSPSEVLEAVRELRRIRDEEGTIKYIGISGYPVDVLVELAELVRRETGEPLDCVMSYANYTLQNRTLLKSGVQGLKAAGVEVVPNASILGMGLLRSGGVPGDWHPAPLPLRETAAEMAARCKSEWGMTIEDVAVKWALEQWWHDGEVVGTSAALPNEQGRGFTQNKHLGKEKIGVTVIGVSTVEELEHTKESWNFMLVEGFKEGSPCNLTERRKKVQECAQKIYEGFGEWKDYSWPSPGEWERETPGLEKCV
jgi:D-arabinose 1-dehydrogenase